MKRTLVFFTVVFALAGFLLAESTKTQAATACKVDSAKGLKAQTTCPVMEGNPINKKVFVDYKCWRIYFCCTMCPPEFNKDPEKYMKKLEASGQAPECINPKACPLGKSDSASCRMKQAGKPCPAMKADSASCPAKEAAPKTPKK